MYDIVATTTNSASTTYCYDTSAGQLFKAMEGPCKGQYFLNVGCDRMVNITMLKSTTERTNDSSFTCMVLKPTEALTLIVR